MTMVEGRYFYPHAARFAAARASLPERRTLRIDSADETLFGEFPLRRVGVSDRLGRIPRRFYLPDGAMFETEDNDGADDLLRGTGKGSNFADRLERSWLLILFSLLVSAAAAYGFVEYGIPAMATWLAYRTPPKVAAVLSQQTLRTLDRYILKPTRLKGQQQAHALAVFAKVTHYDGRVPSHYRLLFRDAPGLGPNAFALPDGEIVVTDGLFPYIKSDTELEGVLAHEASHVDRRHGLQSLYQASLVPAAITLITGDVSQIGQMATILPGILLQSAYIRRFEQQADDDAAETLKANGDDPAALAQLLDRIDAKLCRKKGGCGPSWLGNHPSTADRIHRLMEERVRK
jgi:Zn-dependent protease with chaperone function